MRKAKLFRVIALLALLFALVAPIVTYAQEDEATEEVEDSGVVAEEGDEALVETAAEGGAGVAITMSLIGLVVLLIVVVVVVGAVGLGVIGIGASTVQGGE